MDLRQLLFLKAVNGGAGPKYVNLLSTVEYVKIQGSNVSVSTGRVDDAVVGDGSSDYVKFAQSFPAGTYTLSCKTSGDGISYARLLCNKAFAGGTYNDYYEAYFKDISNGEITLEMSESFAIGLCFRTKTDKAVGAIYDIMFESGSEAHSYVPYDYQNMNKTPYAKEETEYVEM